MPAVNTLPAKPSQSEALIPSAPNMAGTAIVMRRPSAVASTMSHTGVRPERLVLSIPVKLPRNPILVERVASLAAENLSLLVNPRFLEDSKKAARQSWTLRLRASHLKAESSFAWANRAHISAAQNKVVILVWFSTMLNFSENLPASSAPPWETGGSPHANGRNWGVAWGK